MAGPKLLPEIGTGLGSRKKAPAGLGFRQQPVAKPTAVKPAAPPLEAPKPKGPRWPRRTKKPSVNDALKLRAEIMNAASQGDTDQDQVMAALQNSGIQDPNAVEAILGLRLSENAIRYFLSETKNNPKKAMKLAKKFGF